MDAEVEDGVHQLLMYQSKEFRSVYPDPCSVIVNLLAAPLLSIVTVAVAPSHIAIDGKKHH